MQTVEKPCAENIFSDNGILFTVVIPCYNSEKTVTESIQSILFQSERRFILVVVDDGSSDNSLSVVNAAFNGDERCVLIKQDNAGPSAARNRGAYMFGTPLIAFLDADDRWHPDRLKAALEHFRRFPDTAVSFCRIRFFDPLMKTPGRVSTVPEKLLLRDILAENACCTSGTLVFRREFFNQAEGFDVNLRFAEDQDLVARIIAGGGIVRGLDRLLVDYRTSVSGLSSDLPSMEKGWTEMIARIGNIVPEQTAEAEKHARAIFMRYLARRALRLGLSPGTAAGYMLRAFMADAPALLLNQPLRTGMTAAGILAAFIPGIKNTALLRR